MGQISAEITRLPGSLLSGNQQALFVFSLGRALEVLPVGTAYVVWTGIGAVGSVALGVVMFNEPATASRLCWVAVTLVGILGLKATS